MTATYFDDDDYGGFMPGDLFHGEVDSLVTSVYTATLNGIDGWDREAREAFKSTKWSDEKAQELAWWDEQAAMLRCHAGNMGLVSLITMFDHWLIEFEQGGQEIDVFPKAWDHRSGLLKRFERIESELFKKTCVKGTLSSDRLRDLVHARDSIIHHASAAQYVDLKENTITVKDEFLGEIRDTVLEFQICVNGMLLSQFSNEIKQQAALWFSQMGARKTWKP